MTPQLLTTAQAAAQLGLSERQVRHLAGKLGLGQRFGRAILFTPADLAAMKARPRPGTYPRRKSR